MTRWLAPGAVFRSLGACTEAASGPLQQGGLGHQVLSPDKMTLSVQNGTTLTVTLVVNGAAVRTIAPETLVDAMPAAALPALPWAIEARSPSGRVLTSLTVNAGDVWQVTAPNGSVEGPRRGAGRSPGRDRAP